MTAARFFGGLLITVGALIGGLSGLCTAVGLAFSLTGKDMGMAPVVLIVGGPPIAIGVGLFFGGRALWRRGAAPPPKTLEVFDEPPPP
jgi:hypothetical protein